MSDATTRVKLCGLRTAGQVELAVSLGVEFIGLVFAERSRRRVTVEEARRAVSAIGVRAPAARSLLHDGIAAGPWFKRCATALEEALDQHRPLVVGVFAGQPASLVNAICDEVPLDLIQLSGGEPWDTALALRRAVIMALHVGDGAEPAALLSEMEVGTAALCLLDTARPGQQGGTGMTFDWRIAAEVADQAPVMLAGGLNPENVAVAVRQVRPWAVDVSSGIESEGQKDEGKMRSFVAAVRGAFADEPMRSEP